MDRKRPRLDPALVAEYAERIRQAGTIDHTLYDKYNVKRGLRNADGTGVLVGLTRVGSVHGYVISESEKVPVPGQLFYRGVDVKDIVEGCRAEDRFGYEECAYLLLFGELPTKSQLEEWSHTLGTFRRLPDGFKEDAIMRAPGNDVMNSMSRAVLTAFLYDESPDDFSLDNVVRQCIGLIARLPAIAAYSYQAMAHYYQGHSLLIRYPDAAMSAAENILMLSKESPKFSRLEAELLDTCLILHAEHGGGNNSAFTTHVMTSAFTDTYSAIAAAILSLRAPRHGGANLRALEQMEWIKSNVSDWKDEDAICASLNAILDRKAGDGTGLVYGLGHAVYTLSDPRTEVLREKARALAKEKGREEEMALYERVERLGPQVVNSRRAKPHEMCANVDFYSGFVYDMIGMPHEMFTPIFAVARVVGWCAHRLEEVINSGPIIRPAFKAIERSRRYVPIAERPAPGEAK